MHPETATRPILIITADDYGYAPGYNRGILEAAEAGAIDAVGAMVGGRACETVPVLETGTEIGLHLELPGDPAEAQVARFEEIFGGAPAFLNGHHHCHAQPPHAIEVAELAAARGLPVRSVSPAHRALLRSRGCATPDRLIGRLDTSEPALPPLLAGDGALPRGVTEWMVHPGYADPASGSAYDAEREHDLRLVLRLSGTLGRRARRATHSALGANAGAVLHRTGGRRRER